MDALTRLMRETAELGPEGLDGPGADHVDEVWRRGRRRRLVRGAATAAGALAALAVVASLVLGTSRLLPDQVLPADGGQGTGVTAYPQRIGHQWWVSDLGDRSQQPVAALIQLEADRPEDKQWQVVSPDGVRHTIPGALATPADILPAISPDGWRIAYLDSAINRWVVRDLRTGRSLLPPDFGSRSEAGGDSQPTYELASQTPAFFSPSGGHLVVTTMTGPMLLDLSDGTHRALTGMSEPAGWIDEDRIVGRTRSDPDPVTGYDSAVAIVAWNRSTGVATGLGRVTFGETPNGPVLLDGQWWGTVRADRTLWLSVTNQSDHLPWLAGVSLPGLVPVGLDGQQVSTLTWNGLSRLDNPGAAVNGEVLAWRRNTPLAFSDRHVLRAFASGSSAPTTVIDHAVGVYRVTWAQNALDGTASKSVFGTSNAWWTWWWMELALGFLALIAVQWWRHRRSEPGR